MGDTRALALKILLVNAVALAGLAIVTWVGWLPLLEPRRAMMTAAFAACAGIDVVLALLLVSRT